MRFQELGDVSEVRSGWGFPSAEQGSAIGEFAFYKVGDMNLPGNEILMTRANNYVAEETIWRLGVSPARAGTVIFPKIGAAIATNKKRLLIEASAYDNNVMGIVPGDELLPRFLLYVMQTKNLSRIANDSGAVPSIRKSEMVAVRIPVPPLEVQREIVRILDMFTELEAGLQAELDARRRQSEYYRYGLTEAFDSDHQLRSGWNSGRLGDICRIEKGKTPILKAVPGQFPLVTTSNERRSADRFQFNNEAVCIPLISSKGHGVADISRIYYQAGKFALGNILCGLVPNDPSQLSAEFLYHFLSSRKDVLLVPLMRGGANVSLTVDSLKKVAVQFPSLEEQSRIVEAMRGFDTLVNNLNVGLPVELNARRKQYAYYRDKLLTFQKAPA